MNVLKYFKVYLLFFVLSGCGYSSIYKNINDVNFKINFSQMNGVREVNNKVKSNLKQYTLNDSQKIYNISTTSKYNKEILTKDASGAATEFKIYLDIAFEVSSKNYNKIFNFSESFNMQSMSDKIDEKVYEESMRANLINIITEKLISNLMRLK